MKNTYILTSRQIKGELELQYNDGFLYSVKMAFKEQLNEDKFRLLFVNIASREAGLPLLEKLGFTISKQEGPNDKIALFCRVYERFKKVKYKTSAAEAGKVKLVKFDEAMLEHYFTSPNFLFKDKQSISNLVKYYNELRAEIAAGDKPKYPDHYDRAYEAKLNPAELKYYWSHLRGLGLMPKTDRLGNTIDWEKKDF